jgi:hypothetical protein
MSGTLEFATHTLVDKRLDMGIFEGKDHNDGTGRAAYDTKILLKVVLLAYSRGVVSSRKIEQACREDVIFIALGYRSPASEAIQAMPRDPGYAMLRQDLWLDLTPTLT